MPGVARTLVDTAKGVIIGPGDPTVLVNNKPVSVVGDAVAPHGKNKHASAVILNGSSTVFAGGKPIVIEGQSVASCGHPVNKASTNVDAS